MSRRLQGLMIAILSAFCLPTIAQAKGWRGIVPLKSTRADVERLLGLPGKHGRYQFEEERAYINYAGPGPCHPNNTCLCFIKEDIVIGINVELEVEMRFSALKINLKKYKKYVSPQNPALISYSNEEEGIIYTVEDDDVTAIEYLPRAKDCQDVMRRAKPARAQNSRRKARCVSFVKVIPHRRLCSYCMTRAETTLPMCSCWRRGSRETSSNTFRTLPGGLLVLRLVTTDISPLTLNNSATVTQTITAGDGYMEFTPGETVTWRMCGLGNTDSSAYFGDIEYAFYVAGRGMSRQREVLKQ